MRLSITFLLPALLLATLDARIYAGDAVMWSPEKQNFVAEYSGTPEGGKDYLNEEQAEASVGKIVLKQHVRDAVLVWKSDRTGYFAVCTGVVADGKTVAAVGFGGTEVESKLNGLAELRKAGAQNDFFIAYRYASYGHDYAPTSPPLDDLTASPVENEEISSISPDGHFALRTAHSRGWKLRRFDLVDLHTFELPIELGTPTVLFGSMVWSPDSKRFAFFGEERTFGETTAYILEDGKYNQVALPERDKFPDPELGLQPDEQLFKTNSDIVRPKDWLPSGDLEIEHKLEVVVEKNYQQVATVEATTAMTIHFDAQKNGAIVAVSQGTTRKAIAPKPVPKSKIPTLDADLGKKPGK